MHSVPVNVRPAVYCTAITEGNETTWNFLWDRFVTENVAAEQVVILDALGCTKDQAILKVFLHQNRNQLSRWYLRLCLGLSRQNNNKFSETTRQASSFYFHIQQAWWECPNCFRLRYCELFIHQKFVRILLHSCSCTKKLTFCFVLSFGNIGDVATILSNLAAWFSSAAQIEQLETFYGRTSAEFASTTISTAITDAKFNLQWADKHVPDIYNYMSAVSGAPQLLSISFFVLILSGVMSFIWS